MSVFDANLVALTTFQATAERQVIAIAQTYTAEIVDMNTSQQYYGVDAKSRPIAPPYTSFTTSIKQEIGQPTDRVTLRDTEDFHRSFYVVFDQLSFRITARDWKRDRLVNKYGEEIFGLTDENIDNLAQFIKPDLIESFRKKIL